VVLFALPLLASAPSASASNLKTRVWDFFEDCPLCTDGEPDLSQQSSSGKTASCASDCVGRNLFYNRFRYYDPAGGRYISPDPIRLLGGVNLYIFATNPTGWIDPYGLARKRTGCEGTESEQGRLKKGLRKQLREIEDLAAQPGRSGTSRALDRRQVRQLAEHFLGPGYRVSQRGRHGELWLESADGRRMVRMPTEKASTYARTGVQANFHQRPNTRTNFFDPQSASNVHVHVR